MRVISGTARGTKLSSIDDISTRPTLDRVKEALFSKIQNEIIDSVVLDLFAGSGQIGIEFISRGCKKAYFCEKNHLSTKMIYENLQKTRFNEKASVINKEYKKCLQILKEENMQFNIIYVDPPYNTNIAVDAVANILSLDLLKEKGFIIIETDDEKREVQGLEKLNVEIYDIKQYGRVNLIFLNRKG